MPCSIAVLSYCLCLLTPQSQEGTTAGFHLTGRAQLWPWKLGAEAEPDSSLIPLPPLGLFGSYRYADESARGLLSPWLTAGSLSFASGTVTGRLAGVDVPFIGFSPWQVDELRRAGSDSSASWSDADLASLGVPLHRDHPCEIFSLWRDSRASQERDVRFLSLFGSSLVRWMRDVPGAGIDADLDRFPRGLIAGIGPDSLRECEAKVGELDKLENQRADERLGILGPIFMHEARANGASLLALRPLLAYDSERGLSLPWAVTTLGGSEAGFPSAEACAHLFPLVWRGDSRSTWGFLWPLGSVYHGQDFTIADVKFLMNTQWHRERGASFGLLPYPFGSYPRDAFTRDFPQFHLRGHGLWWSSIDGRKHFSIAEPLLFRYDQSGPSARREVDVGPFGILSRYSSSSRRAEFSLLTVPLLEASLLRCEWQADGGREFEILPAPYLSLLAYRGQQDAGQLCIGPYGVVLDLDVGPDRLAFALTPLVRYERQGSSRRLRLFFLDVYTSGVYAESP